MDITRFTDILTKNILWILLLLTLFIIYFVPIHISSNISISGKIYPAKQWVLFAGTNGQIMNTQTDMVAGVSHDYQNREFSRGDDVHFAINPKILSQSLVHKNDTIGVIYSNTTNMELNEALTDLSVQEAELASFEAGLNDVEVEIIRKRLAYAEIEAEKQQKEFLRQKELYKQEVIPDQDYEDQQRAVELAQAQVSILEAELDAALSGQKPEDIDLVKAKLEKIKSRISDLESKLEMQTILSPITGIFQNSYSADTLLVIESLDELIIKMPVGLKDRQRVFIGQRVSSRVPGQKLDFISEVVHISNHVNASGGKQTFIVTAVVHNQGAELLPGIVFKGKLQADKILLRDYVMRWFSFFNKWVS